MYVGNLEHQFHESLLHLVLWPSAVILEDSINACLPSRSTGINTTVLLPRALTHNISSGPCLSVTKKHKKSSLMIGYFVYVVKCFYIELLRLGRLL